jgi:hypothetical protein
MLQGANEWAGFYTPLHGLHLTEQIANLAKLCQSRHCSDLPFASQDVVWEGARLATVLLKR